ncbi:hedgehog signaling/DD-peptidase zinc-binding domain protein [Vibrio phage 1.193.O._10N.286.52.C6]|nr:hedgehog signaling/DD-peptidase zinc-binding domain protein [Vibrio phage 1.193.O._10N.286.52.C6]
MAWKLSSKSKAKLEGVHPDLVRVVYRALEISPYDFGITEGKRTLKVQKQYVAAGKSKTMDSMHLEQDDGWSYAIDLSVFAPKLTWEHKHFRKVIQAFVTAAIEEEVQLRFGGLWENFLDSPHIELNRKYYNI